MWKWSDLKRIFMRKAADNGIADLGAVMWPVSYPADMAPPEHPHITVVIFKDINNEDLGYTREDVMEAVRNTVHDVMLFVNVDGLDWFGANQDVPVLRVSHMYLDSYRVALIKELDKRGIPIVMTFPEYKPHVTITDIAALNGLYPNKLLTGPVEVWWAEEHFKVD